MDNLFEIGFSQPLLIRDVILQSQPDQFRVLYISDLHLRLGRSALLCDQILKAAESAMPDVILLGGDLVDQRSALGDLANLVTRLQKMSPVLAVAGNHDARLGIPLVREAVESRGAIWIHDSVARFTQGSRVISIAGPESVSVSKTTTDSANLHPPPGVVRILCAHNPRIWKTAKDQEYDLVLAGHLHGCQFVAFEFRNRLYPGAWFYPYCYLNHQSQRSMLVVSRGVSDLIPIRWRCPREVVLCLV